MNNSVEKHMNILFSSDDNYAKHLGVAIYSLLDCNKEFEKISIFVIENEISCENKNRLLTIVNYFKNAKIFFIPFAECKKQLVLDMEWEISISAYGRLFLGKLLPKSIDKVLYLDCDMIVKQSLMELWNTNLKGYILGAVQDTVCQNVKTAVGLSKKDNYFNSGLLLVDLKAWRDKCFDEICMNFIKDKKGRVIHHDQGVLNGVFKNNWCKLDLKYNVMTLHYFFTRKLVMKYFKEMSDYYSDEQIEAAKKSPVILHYTPSFTSRPWCKNSKHPFLRYYWEIIAKTPFAGAKPEKDRSKLKVKLVNWFYRNFYF